MSDEDRELQELKKQYKGKELAKKLLEKGKIELNKKGEPSIKDIMGKAEISRSYAFASRRDYLRVKKAMEGAPLGSEVEVTEPEVTKPKPPPRTEEKKVEKPTEEELDAEKPTAITYEEMLEELNEYEEMLTDIYELTIGKESILTTVTKDEDYGRPTSTCKRLARNWVRWLKRRVDPETMAGYDTVFLVGNHISVAVAILFVYFGKRKEEAEKKKKA